MKMQSKLALIVAALVAAASAHTDPMLPPFNQPPDNVPVPFLQAMAAPRHMPVVAVVALNEGTETTDFLVPHAVLQRAGIATVEAVAPRSGPVALMPALTVDVPRDLASFDRSYPQGADYVVVPAMHTDDDPVILAWLRAQAAKGARILGICSGARVLGQAGLLEGRQFTGHWYDRSTLTQRHPSARYVPDRRYLADGKVLTTTGVTASLPVSLALVEAIGGRDHALALAQTLGVPDWGAQHDSAPFKLSAVAVWTLAMNTALFWRHETQEMAASDGMDDIALALSADAWSRTYRSNARATTPDGTQVWLRSGLRLHTTAARTSNPITLDAALPPACHLDATLQSIARHYGENTRQWVATQIEYPPAPPYAAACHTGG